MAQHHSDDVLLALDVGGTNTRARVRATASDGNPELLEADITARVVSARELSEFVTQLAEIHVPGNRISAAVVAVAGPVTGDRVRITNWPFDSQVSLSGLEDAGLPRGRTLLVNDVVAGAWGALARINSHDHAMRPRLLAGPESLASGNVVYLAPGTGLGSSALVRHGFGPFGASAVACETQHTQMPRSADEIGRVADALQAVLGHPASWEELVSGRGLVSIYQALRAIRANELLLGLGDASQAGRIADAAAAGVDPLALEAVNIYYRVLGGFAQTLALTFLPCAAVVIGGASTDSNMEMMRSAGLAETFVEHRQFRGLLGAVPIFMVGADVNLEGGIWLADHS